MEQQLTAGVSNEKSFYFLLADISNKVTALYEMERLRSVHRNKTFSIEEAAEYLGLHAQTVRKRVNLLDLNPNGEGERKRISLTFEEVEQIRLNDRAGAHIASMNR